MTELRSIWLVRHAPVAVSGICYGQSDVPVALGPREVAAQLAASWQSENADVRPELWSSPLARCRLVAEELAELWQCGVHIDTRLAELSFGEWEGKTFAELERDDGERLQRWMANYEELAPPTGETVSELMTRVASWFRERQAASTLDTPVLAVCHAGVIRSARALLRGLPYRSFVSDPAPHLELERLT
jgi:alpha-ribazole phosphatase